MPTKRDSSPRPGSNRPVRRCHVLSAGAEDSTLRLLFGLIQAKVLTPKARTPRGTQRVVSFMTKHSKDDLLALNELIEAGKLTPVVDRTYPLSEAAKAIRHVGEKRARGKVIITIDSRSA